MATTCYRAFRLSEFSVPLLPNTRDPQPYVSLAESLWSDEFDNRWAQENLTWADQVLYEPRLLLDLQDC
jgi:hypothetical protein